jgi:hypothetical protein
MKRVLGCLTCSLMILSVLVFSSNPTFAFETEALVLPRVEILIPGVNRTISITQNYKFPQDFNQIIILAIGYGPLPISMTHIATEGTSPEGNILMLTGMGVSAAGVIPVFKFGVTQVTLQATVEIGNERSPYGLLWISSWVDSSVNDPPYNYILTLSF